MTTDSGKSITGALLEAFAWRCLEITPGEVIDDATDLLMPGEGGDTILEHIRKALWSIDGFDLDESAEFLTYFSVWITQ